MAQPPLKKPFDWEGVKWIVFLLLAAVTVYVLFMAWVVYHASRNGVSL